MTRQGSTEEIRVMYAPAVADTAAPTVAEAETGGTDLTPNLVRNGLTTPQAGNVMDSSDAASKFNKQTPSTYGGDSVQITFHRGDDPGTDDTAWETLPRTTAGFLIIRRFGGSDVAIAAADVVEVWPGTVVSREMQPIADNETQRFTVTFAVTDVPDDDAVVAA